MPIFINLEIALNGHASVGWPLITVDFNGRILHDGEVHGPMLIESRLAGQPHNLLIIKHHGKHDGSVTQNSDGTWNDRWCDLDYVGINGLRFDLDFFSHQQICYHADDGESRAMTYFGKNGQFRFDFELPMWKFWARCNKVDQ